MNSTQLPLFITHLTSHLNSVQPDEVVRVFHGRGQVWPGLEQITADWIGGYLQVSLFKPCEDDFLNSLKAQLLELSNSPLWPQIHGQGLYIQHRYQNPITIDTLVGEIPSTLVAQERGLNYKFSLGTNQNIGLFLDMVDGRSWVKSQSKNSAVLNLFSYTCGFSVAAIAGGADRVVNVDMAKSSLSRGRDNHKLNQHDISGKVSFLGHDIFKSWGKIKKLGGYDLIIIDPPSFQKGSFAATKDYQRILRRLPDLLNAGGHVLACVNAPSLTSQFLIDEMAREAPDLTFIRRLENPAIFADIDSEAALKVLLFKDQA
ncbi:class I SAM-dependent methyltransferase [Vibrio sp. SS-MA-C1-2]|uniref:class I SAM-dependent methyltransferase n=1 Tax=Vibrio sp. SS-MA-C1-2 TaxID=2908646 RepID=UPI001F428A71|nr:class I SAM-dependent methyltransferase [Vibrio sp. SS-MA-C1-2]UJF20120.1 class I SAM-dependent methyltransferase [Vibrio sp. SS-MA-C1-2]